MSTDINGMTVSQEEVKTLKKFAFRTSVASAAFISIFLCTVLQFICFIPNLILQYGIKNILFWIAFAILQIIALIIVRRVFKQLSMDFYSSDSRITLEEKAGIRNPEADPLKSLNKSGYRGQTTSPHYIAKNISDISKKLNIFILPRPLAVIAGCLVFSFITLMISLLFFIIPQVRFAPVREKIAAEMSEIQYAATNKHLTCNSITTKLNPQPPVSPGNVSYSYEGKYEISCLTKQPDNTMMITYQFDDNGDIYGWKLYLNCSSSADSEEFYDEVTKFEETVNSLQEKVTFTELQPIDIVSEEMKNAIEKKKTSFYLDNGKGTIYKSTKNETEILIEYIK